MKIQDKISFLYIVLFLGYFPGYSNINYLIYAKLIPQIKGIYLLKQADNKLKFDNKLEAIK